MRVWDHVMMLPSRHHNVRGDTRGRFDLNRIEGCRHFEPVRRQDLDRLVEVVDRAFERV
jgi:hypothetical protein